VTRVISGARRGSTPFCGLAKGSTFIVTTARFTPVLTAKPFAA